MEYTPIQNTDSNTDSNIEEMLANAIYNDDYNYLQKVLNLANSRFPSLFPLDAKKSQNFQNIYAQEIADIAQNKLDKANRAENDIALITNPETISMATEEADQHRDSANIAGLQARSAMQVSENANTYSIDKLNNLKELIIRAKDKLDLIKKRNAYSVFQEFNSEIIILFKLMLSQVISTGGNIIPPINALLSDNSLHEKEKYLIELLIQFINKLKQNYGLDNLPITPLYEVEDEDNEDGNNSYDISNQRPCNELMCILFPSDNFKNGNYYLISDNYKFICPAHWIVQMNIFFQDIFQLFEKKANMRNNSSYYYKIYQYNFRILQHIKILFKLRNFNFYETMRYGTSYSKSVKEQLYDGGDLGEILSHGLKVDGSFWAYPLRAHIYGSREVRDHFHDNLYPNMDVIALVNDQYVNAKIIRHNTPTGTYTIQLDWDPMERMDPIPLTLGMRVLVKPKDEIKTGKRDLNDTEKPILIKGYVFGFDPGHELTGPADIAFDDGDVEELGVERNRIYNESNGQPLVGPVIDLPREYIIPEDKFKSDKYNEEHFINSNKAFGGKKYNKSLKSKKKYKKSKKLIKKNKKSKKLIKKKKQISKKNLKK